MQFNLPGKTCVHIGKLSVILETKKYSEDHRSYVKLCK